MILKVKLQRKIGKEENLLQGHGDELLVNMLAFVCLGILSNN
jgi:hypothetical protein